MSELSNWYKKRIKEMGYNGCRNCKHQIEPLRGCEWLEHGGDGVIHLICPKWEKKKMQRLIDADELKTAFPCGESVRTESVRATIDHMATVDAEPVRHGHWVHLGGDEWCCDKCGFVISTEGSWQHPKAKEAGHDYCKHCGAKMDETEYEEPEINPCRGCEDYDGKGGCLSKGGCGAHMDEVKDAEIH